VWKKAQKRPRFALAPSLLATGRKAFIE